MYSLENELLKEFKNVNDVVKQLHVHSRIVKKASIPPNIFLKKYILQYK